MSQINSKIIPYTSTESKTTFCRQKMTVFCDFDGPIVDVSERYYSTYRQALAETKQAYQAKDIELPVTELNQASFWCMKQNRVPDEEIAMRSGLQGSEIQAFLTRVQEIVNQPDLLHKDRLQPGVEWALGLLHSQGFRLVLVTLRRQTQAQQILQNYGLLRLFTSIWGTQDDHSAYQNYTEIKQQLLSAAIAKENIPTDTAWMIGDTEADILAGQACAITTIALTCGLRSRTYLTKYNPHNIMSDLLSATNFLIAQKQRIPA